MHQSRKVNKVRPPFFYLDDSTSKAGKKFQFQSLECGVLASAAQDFTDECALGLIVCLTVGAKFVRELALQSGVGVRILGMASEVVPERDMPSVLFTAGWANIKVMEKIARRGEKGLAARDPQISAMLISQGCQSMDDQWKIAGRYQEYVDVDDRLRSQSGNRGATDMLDRSGQAAKYGSNW